MSKILLTDPYGLKFASYLKDWWEDHGHEVQYQRYYNPQLANEWADIIYFETADNNIASATNPGSAILADDANYLPWSLSDMDLTGKRVIVRAIDIEVWLNHTAAANWSKVNDLIFIAPHIRNLVDIDALPGVHEGLRVHTIPCPIDLNKWTFKERGHGFDIAVVSEKWSSKGTHEILHIALKLKKINPRYKIHWLGQRSDSPWEYAWFDDFVERHNLNIEFTNILNDGTTVDEFLEDKNYLLHGSVKEGYSYAMAEAAAKGIKVVANRFYGADWLWGDSGFLWDSLDEAVAMIIGGDYDSKKYRQYLIDKGYDLPTVMSKIDKVIKGE